MAKQRSLHSVPYTLCSILLFTFLQSCTDTVVITRDVDRARCLFRLFGALPRHLKFVHTAEAYIFDLRSQVDDVSGFAVAVLNFAVPATRKN